jgi:hypothetical protein
MLAGVIDIVILSLACVLKEKYRRPRGLFTGSAVLLADPGGLEVILSASGPCKALANRKGILNSHRAI